METKCSLWGTALIIATLLLLLGALYVRPAVEPVSHGVYYAELSKAPFDPNGNPEAYRILTPLIAYLTGLRGNRILILNLILTWALLAIIYRHYRTHERSAFPSLMRAAMLAFSMPTLFTIHINGYTDAASFLLLFLLFVNGERALLSGALLLLAMLNHESVLFLAPFLLLLQAKAGVPLRRSLPILIVSLALYGVIRLMLSLQVVVEYSIGYYLQPLLRDPFYWIKKASQAYYLGFCTAFKLFWLIPLAAVILLWQERRYRDMLLIVSPIVLSMGQAFLAIDTSRMLSMAFPAILLGIETLEERFEAARLEPALLGLCGANLLAPQIYVAGNAIYTMQTLLGWLLRV